MDYKAMEREIFANGCYITFEFITDDNKRIRFVRTLDNDAYKMIYVRNKNYVFVIDTIIKL